MIFLDGCNLHEIQKYARAGVISGVTTNPTILAKGTVDPWIDWCKRILLGVAPLPVSVQTNQNSFTGIISQAHEWKEWGANIVFKIPIHSPVGQSWLDAIHDASEQLPINVTACMSAQQSLLAACAGAAYVSLFCGRIANMGHEPIDELERLRNLIDREGLPTKIIACSVREVANVTDWLVAGAHIVTVPPEILEKMIVHPGTKEVVTQFLKDAEGLT